MVRATIYGSILFWAGIFCPDSGYQQSLAAAAGQPQLLVLRNGSILQGEITRRGSYYHVAMLRGELQVPVGQVEICCRNLAEAYQCRRAARVGSTGDSHRQLAAWCLRHDMLEYAAIELRAAGAIDPAHPGLKILENQLAQATRRRSSQPRPPRPTADSVSSRPATAAKERDLPPAARRQFVRQIEPILISSCATSGCHGSDSARSLRLDRLAIVGAGHPGLTRKNLANLLAQVDSTSPDGNSLLAHATTEHGAERKRSKPLSVRQSQLLQSWIRLISAARQGAEGGTKRSRADAPMQDPKLTSVSHAAGERVGLVPQSRAAKPLRATPKIENPRPTKKLQRGARLTTFSPRDPFDAEIFNRRVGQEGSVVNPPSAGGH